MTLKVAAPALFGVSTPPPQLHANLHSMRTVPFVLCTAAVILAPAAYADNQLDLSGANDTYIMAPTGSYDSLPGYWSTVENLYLAPLGDTGPYTALENLPTNSYNYEVTVPEGAQQIADQVNADYQAGELSAAHPDVLFGYSVSAVMTGEAESILYNQDHIPTQDVQVELVGDTANPETGFFVNPANDWLLQLFGMSNLIGLSTPESYYNTDIYTLESAVNGSDFWGCNTCVDPNGFAHEGYIGLTLQQIQDATETTVNNLSPDGVDVATNFFTVDTPNLWTTLWDALVNLG